MANASWQIKWSSIASSVRVISEQYIRKDVKGSDSDLLWSRQNTLAHAWRYFRNHKNLRITSVIIPKYTGWFRRKGRYFGRWYYQLLWEKKVHMNMCLILNVYRDTYVWMCRPNSVIFLFVELKEERSLQNKGGYSRRIARSHFWCCWLHRETWRPTILEYLLCTVTDLWFLCNKFVI